MSDDWVYVGPTGPTPKADVIGAIATGRLAHHSMQSTGAWDGRTYAADEWISEVYVRRNGRWLCVLSQKCAAEG